MSDTSQAVQYTNHHIVGQSLHHNTYTLQQILGRGGMSTVYLALHTPSQQLFALKQNRADAPLPSTIINELHTHLTSPALRHLSEHASFPSSGGIYTDSFLREALLLARLHHPALPRLHNYFFAHGSWYLVMDYLPGPTLSTYLQQHAPLPPLEALNYALQLCDILEYLHQNTPPIIYRDLKPANIILSPDGALKLIDFGIARYHSSTPLDKELEFGSPGYASPEQCRSTHQLDPRSDLYSLGVILHEMLYAQRPAPQKMLTASMDLSQTLQGLLALALQPTPEKRFQSAHLLSLALIRAYDIEESRTHQRYFNAPQRKPAVTLISTQELYQRPRLQNNSLPSLFLKLPQTAPSLSLTIPHTLHSLYVHPFFRRSAQSAFLLTLLLALLFISLLITLHLPTHTSSSPTRYPDQLLLPKP